MTLTAAELAILDADCPCGHPPESHGSELFGCKLCPEEGRHCQVTFTELVAEAVGEIVAGRVAESRSAVPAPPTTPEGCQAVRTTTEGSGEALEGEA